MIEYSANSAGRRPVRFDLPSEPCRRFQRSPDHSVPTFHFPVQCQFPAHLSSSRLRPALRQPSLRDGQPLECRNRKPRGHEKHRRSGRPARSTSARTSRKPISAPDANDNCRSASSASVSGMIDAPGGDPEVEALDRKIRSRQQEHRLLRQVHDVPAFTAEQQKQRREHHPHSVQRDQRRARTRRRACGTLDTAKLHVEQHAADQHECPAPASVVPTMPPSAIPSRIAIIEFGAMM